MRIVSKTQSKISFVALDVETTGLSPHRGDRVVEVGAVLVRNGELCEKYTSLINCRRRIPNAVRKISGITREMLLGQPEPELVFRELLDFIQDYDLVAHNAEFEMDFLKMEYQHLGLDFKRTINCSLKLSRTLLWELKRFSLQDVALSLFEDLPPDLRLHRALSDALLTAQVWLKLTMLQGERQ